MSAAFRVSMKNNFRASEKKNDENSKVERLKGYKWFKSTYFEYCSDNSSQTKILY